MWRDEEEWNAVGYRQSGSDNINGGYDYFAEVVIMDNGQVHRVFRYQVAGVLWGRGVVRYSIHYLKF